MKRCLQGLGRAQLAQLPQQPQRVLVAVNEREERRKHTQRLPEACRRFQRRVLAALHRGQESTHVLQLPVPRLERELHRDALQPRLVHRLACRGGVEGDADVPFQMQLALVFAQSLTVITQRQELQNCFSTRTSVFMIMQTSEICVNLISQQLPNCNVFPAGVEVQVMLNKLNFQPNIFVSDFNYMNPREICMRCADPSCAHMVFHESSAGVVTVRSVSHVSVVATGRVSRMQFMDSRCVDHSYIAGGNNSIIFVANISSLCQKYFVNVPAYEPNPPTYSDNSGVARTSNNINIINVTFQFHFSWGTHPFFFNND